MKIKTLFILFVFLIFISGCSCNRQTVQNGPDGGCSYTKVEKEIYTLNPDKENFIFLVSKVKGGPYYVFRVNKLFGTKMANVKVADYLLVRSDDVEPKIVSYECNCNKCSGNNENTIYIPTNAEVGELNMMVVK